MTTILYNFTSLCCDLYTDDCFKSVVSFVSGVLLRRVDINDLTATTCIATIWEIGWVVGWGKGRVDLGLLIGINLKVFKTFRGVCLALKTDSGLFRVWFGDFLIFKG